MSSRPKPFTTAEHAQHRMEELRAAIVNGKSDIQRTQARINTAQEELSRLETQFVKGKK